jgi:hypothetical protein
MNSSTGSGFSPSLTRERRERCSLHRDPWPRVVAKTVHDRMGDAGRVEDGAPAVRELAQLNVEVLRFHLDHNRPQTAPGVCSKSVSVLSTGQNCLRRSSPAIRRVSGRSRVPSPRARMSPHRGCVSDSDMAIPLPLQWTPRTQVSGAWPSPSASISTRRRAEAAKCASGLATPA